MDALRNCINKPKCQDCHWEECDKFHETFELPKGLVMDMYDLLKDPTNWKEQEPVKPEASCEMMYLTNCCCSNCGVQLIREDLFCRCCGRRIDWSTSEKERFMKLALEREQGKKKSTIG